MMTRVIGYPILINDKYTLQCVYKCVKQSTNISDCYGTKVYRISVYYMNELRCNEKHGRCRVLK